MKVNCLVTLIICVILISSCGGKNDNDVIKYEDIGASSNYNANTSSKPSDTNQSTDTSFNTTNLKIEIGKILEINSNEFLDRFESSKNLKRLIINSNDSIYFKAWTFEDSTDTFNAFYNLLDCFGTNCTPLELYSDDFTSSNYNLFFISKNQIHWILSSKNQDKLVWESYLSSEFQSISYYFIMEQKRNQNIIWLEKSIKPNTFKVLNSDL